MYFQFKNGCARKFNAKNLFEVNGWKICRVLHCCSKFQKICSTASPLKRRARSSARPNFLKFGADIQYKTMFPTIHQKHLFSIQISCARHFLFVVKDNTPLPSESTNFVIFSFILHHKYQNNLSEQKTTQSEPLSKVKSDFRSVQSSFIHPV